MSTYAYIRVSSITQSIDRQLAEIMKLKIKKKDIFIDKESGKDFSRKNYQKLRRKLKPNDLLIIKSIDRLGRNYEMIIKEWGYITKNINANILVLDMPLLDTRSQPENLVGRFISDIVLQVLSFVAENERNNIRQRQAEGIRLAKEKGKHLGRPKYCLPENFNRIRDKYINNKINLNDALKLLHMKKSTFYKYIKTV